MLVRVVIILRRKMCVHSSFKLLLNIISLKKNFFFLSRRVIRKGSDHESKIREAITWKDYANRSTAHVGRIIYIIIRDTSLFLFRIIVICSRNIEFFFFALLGREPTVRYCGIVPAIKFHQHKWFGKLTRNCDYAPSVILIHMVRACNIEYCV